MLIYTIRRLLHLIPVLFVLTVAVFSIAKLLPGNLIDTLVGDEVVIDAEVRAFLEKEYGLDKPVYVQYGVWLGRVLRGDFGHSVATNRPVLDELFDVFPATVYLAVTGIGLAFLIAVPLGTLAAANRNSALDYTAQLIAMAGISIPEFLFAILCILLLSLYLGILPTSGFVSPFEDFGQSLYYLALPAMVIGFRHAAYMTRLTRSSMLDETNKGYVDTARSLGFSERRIHYKYTLRNALIPTVTVGGGQLADALGGTLIIETIFAWPGIGYEIYLSLTERDFPTMLAGVLLLGFIVVVTNLLVDLLYRVLNPRITLS